jgi:hypothetical protein
LIRNNFSDNDQDRDENFGQTFVEYPVSFFVGPELLRCLTRKTARGTRKVPVHFSRGSGVKIFTDSKNAAALG